MNKFFKKGTRLQSVTNSQSRTLADQIGSGGECTVFDCKEFPGIAIGIPHQMTAEKEERMLFLQAWKPAIGISKNFAWANDMIADETGRIVGFAMPKINGEVLANYLSPQTRPATTTYLFVLKIFRSLAASIHGAHASGFRVADLNEYNVMVKDSGEIAILDVLSFSFTHSQLAFTTESGVAEYLPPELQEAFSNAQLGNVHRTIHGDSWAFAILFWKALMEGFHPFSNREFVPIEDAVRNHQWPQSANTALHPKSACPAFTCLPTPLAELFRQCFEAGLSDPSARPLILDWHCVIDELIELEEKAQPQQMKTQSGSANSAIANILTPVVFLILIVTVSSPILFELVSTKAGDDERNADKRETPKLWKALKRNSSPQGE